MTTLKFERQVLKALEKSIKDKWEPLASGKFKGMPKTRCALCDLHIPCKKCVGGNGVLCLAPGPYRTWSVARYAGINAPATVRAAKKVLSKLRTLLRKQKAKVKVKVKKMEARKK